MNNIDETYNGYFGRSPAPIPREVIDDFERQKKYLQISINNLEEDIKKLSPNYQRMSINPIGRIKISLNDINKFIGILKSKINQQNIDEINMYRKVTEQLIENIDSIFPIISGVQLDLQKAKKEVPYDISDIRKRSSNLIFEAQQCLENINSLIRQNPYHKPEEPIPEQIYTREDKDYMQQYDRQEMILYLKREAVITKLIDEVSKNYYDVLDANPLIEELKTELKRIRSYINTYINRGLTREMFEREIQEYRQNGMDPVELFDKGFESGYNSVIQHYHNFVRSQSPGLTVSVTDYHINVIRKIAALEYIIETIKSPRYSTRFQNIIQNLEQYVKLFYQEIDNVVINPVEWQKAYNSASASIRTIPDALKYFDSNLDRGVIECVQSFESEKNKVVPSETSIEIETLNGEIGKIIDQLTAKYPSVEVSDNISERTVEQPIEDDYIPSFLRSSVDELDSIDVHPERIKVKPVPVVAKKPVKVEVVAREKQPIKVQVQVRRKSDEVTHVNIPVKTTNQVSTIKAKIDEYRDLISQIANDQKVLSNLKSRYNSLRGDTSRSASTEAEKIWARIQYITRIIDSKKKKAQMLYDSINEMLTQKAFDNAVVAEIHELERIFKNINKNSGFKTAEIIPIEPYLQAGYPIDGTTAIRKR